MVAEVARLILANVEDDRLHWTSDRLSCRVVLEQVVPAGPRQASEERQRRFNEALRSAMSGTGWILSGGWWRRPRPAAARRDD
jgi:hypothetical protein